MKKIIHRIKYMSAVLVLMGGFSFAFLTPVASARLFDGAKQEACAGAELSGGGGPNCGADDSSRLSTTIQDGIDLISIVVGIIAVIMIIIGGIRFVVSDGDSGKVSTARNTIIYALVGLLLVAFAQTIVKFVLNRV